MECCPICTSSIICEFLAEEVGEDAGLQETSDMIVTGISYEKKTSLTGTNIQCPMRGHMLVGKISDL